MDRKIARACAMKLIYEWEMGGDGGEETRTGLLELTPGETEADYMERMFSGVTASLEQVDARIAAHLRGWTIERLPRVDLAILRLATYELMLGEVPPGVVVNEAVELAGQFSTEKAGSFINGVLGSIIRDRT